ncbi:YdcF family protein [Suttonella sp. R2A3]|uniref:SanA/YdcF family protein n=1 Tax=Suttonella sp. R2A3 TaxID=2908648 RepID=UPI001F1D6F27|nr:ElyC/SanA/YdcF family protein [Suttonella sp. R2A3]UJF23734.1 YdcF family protein [Suttonella sp. R2A3]
MAFVSVLLLVILTPLMAYWWVGASSSAYLYDRVEDVPEHEVAVILGTAKTLAGGQINPFYSARIRAAVALYQAGKSDYFIVSGANHTAYYNEPAQMRADLIAAGIPAEHIQPDYAGLRTLDSILRAEHIFGNTRYIIVSQAFHNARAVYIARQNGHDVVAFNADDVSWRFGLKTYIREFGARLKALIDLHVTKTKAKYYGDPIPFPPTKTSVDTPNA